MNSPDHTTHTAVEAALSEFRSGNVERATPIVLDHRCCDCGNRFRTPQELRAHTRCFHEGPMGRRRIPPAAEGVLYARTPLDIYEALARGDLSFNEFGLLVYLVGCADRNRARVGSERLRNSGTK